MASVHIIGDIDSSDEEDTLGSDNIPLDQFSGSSPSSSGQPLVRPFEDYEEDYTAEEDLLLGNNSNGNSNHHNTNTNTKRKDKTKDSLLDLEYGREPLHFEEEEEEEKIDNGGSTSTDMNTNNNATNKKGKDEANTIREPNGSTYKPPSTGLHVRRILALAKPEIWLIVLGTISLAIASASFLFLPNYAGKIIDAVSKGGKDELNHALFALTVVFTISALFTFFRAALFTIAGERVVARLRKNLFEAIIQQEIGFFDVNKTGELVNRMSSDCTVVQNAVTVNISMLLRFAAQTFGGVIVLFFISWKLTLVMLSVCPPTVIGAVIYGKYVKNLSKQQQDAQALGTESAEEALGNIRTVKSFSAEDFETERYGERVNTAYLLARKLAFAFGLFAGGVAFAANVAIVLVLWEGGRLVISGEMSTGTLTSFILYTLTVAVSLGGLSSLYGDFMKAIGASSRIFYLLDRPPQVRCKGGKVLAGVKGELELRNVSFAYPSRTQSKVLHDLSLSLSPGQIVALVGPSGAGKSTIIHLLEQFYYPTSGAIYLDGVDLTEIDPVFLHKQIGLVSQEPVLFGTTIAENIAYGMQKGQFTQDDIERVARLANAHEFIKKLPQKYDTLVGERGITLSGGQKQRVAIARALLKNPRILLLDEATSALDTESEHLVQEALERLMEGRTVLVVAHRLSTVKNADVVCVVHKGRIVEKGTHEELLALGGIYLRLQRRQLQQQVSAAPESATEI